MNDPRYRCSRCQGSGYFVYEEAEVGRDTCYHCGGDGFVPFQTASVDRAVALFETIAYKIINNRRKAANENEDGEGWAFHASENGMTEGDYTRVMTWTQTAIVESEMKNLPSEILSALCNLVQIEMPLYDEC